MRILNFNVEDQLRVFETVAGVLHFGNVRFKVVKRANQEDSADVANMEVLEHAARLWGVDPAAIAKSLLTRNIGTREVIMVSYNVTQAQVTSPPLTLPLSVLSLAATVVGNVIPPL